MDDGTRDEIERLEAQIEDLADRLEGCRKLILAARVATVAGATVLIAILCGAIRFDPIWMALAATALLGGIVVWGSNGSTAQETRAEIAAAEARRATLIGTIDLRVVAERPTLH